MSRAHSSLFAALGITNTQKQRISTESGISKELLSFYDKNYLLPSESELEALCRVCGVSPLVVKLRMGFIDQKTLDLIQSNASAVASLLNGSNSQALEVNRLNPAFQTDFGTLYQGDCLQLMRQQPSESFELVFADPPFNLNKAYPSQMDDKLKEEDYLRWCYEWLDECVRVLKRNGSLFVYNLPKWNIPISDYLSRKLVFRDWITIDIKGHLPLAGRLYPSHYSLVYFCKGDRPQTFNPDRMPMKVCPACYADLVDYGGYKSKMNEKGVSLTDVWADIPLVRHSKYKKREGANELSVRLMDRVIQMASNEGDTVFDPFGGSGTTYAVAELKRRRWVGVEIGPLDGIIERMTNLEEEREVLENVRKNYNMMFPPDVEAARRMRKLWTMQSVRAAKPVALELPL